VHVAVGEAFSNDAATETAAASKRAAPTADASCHGRLETVANVTE